MEYYQDNCIQTDIGNYLPADGICNENYPALRENNKGIYHLDKTKYIVTEYYGGKLKLKDAIMGILHSQYQGEKQNRLSGDA